MSKPFYDKYCDATFTDPKEWLACSLDRLTAAVAENAANGEPLSEEHKILVMTSVARIRDRYRKLLRSGNSARPPLLRQKHTGRPPQVIYM